MASDGITGSTRLYAIVGDPVVQVRSPEVFTARFRAAGWDAVLLPAHVPLAEFDTIVPALLALGNLDGVLVTVPFKARMTAFAARLGEAAAIVGAVNALRRERDGSWTGDMFDGAGFTEAALQKGARLRERRVLLFGAGGAGSAIACALAEAGAASIDIVDPDASRLHELLRRLASAFPHCRIAAATAGGDFDMVVNASPVGMRPTDGLPGALGPLHRDTLVGDVIISSRPTPLVELALCHGCACVTGRDMHAGQVDAIMRFFATTAAIPEHPA